MVRLHRPIAAYAVILLSHCLNFRFSDSKALPRCYLPCITNPNGNELVPGTECSQYIECSSGRITARRSCAAPLVFDLSNGYCNFKNQVDCPPDQTCEPSYAPTVTPQILPTETPTLRPITAFPTASPVIGGKALEYIISKRVLFEKKVLVSYTAAGVAYQSTLYTFDEMRRGFNVMSTDGFGADEFNFLLWDSTGDYYYGLTNVAAFLANAMVESISTDSCDESHEEGINGRYAISNSCGQYKRDYQDEVCAENNSNTTYSCTVDVNMEITAVTSPSGARSPPPFFCKPGSSYTGYWDANTGMPVSAAYSNTGGRTDVEGCCWWGRGALLTRNICNIGKLNYYLGKGGANDNRDVLYPDIDFCANPEVTCSSPIAKELVWRTAMFEWADRVQRYNSDGWKYEDQLKQFVDGDMSYTSLRDFITSTSRVLLNDCHQRGCTQSSNPDSEIRNLDERIANFDMIVNQILEIKNLLVPTPKPISPPTSSNPKPTPLLVSPSFFSNDDIELVNPSPSIEQTNSEPTIPPGPPTPAKAPAFFQPSQPKPSVTQNNPVPEEDDQYYDDEYAMSDLIKLEGNSASQIFDSRILLVMTIATTLQYYLVRLL